PRRSSDLESFPNDPESIAVQGPQANVLAFHLVVLPQHVYIAQGLVGADDLIRDHDGRMLGTSHQTGLSEHTGFQQMISVGQYGTAFYGTGAAVDLIVDKVQGGPVKEFLLIRKLDLHGQGLGAGIPAFSFLGQPYIFKVIGLTAGKIKMDGTGGHYG